MSRFSDDVENFATKAEHIVPVMEYLTDSDNNSPNMNMVDCNQPENKNNPICTAPDDILNIIIIFIILAIITYVIVIWGAIKTKNEGLKIFLIVSLFLPFLAPISFILALLIIVGVIS